MSVLLRNANIGGARDVGLADSNASGYTDILIEAGRIARIAPGLHDGSAETVDLEGRVVIPGLWDNHVHMSQWAFASSTLSLAAASSARQAADMVSRALSAEPAKRGGVDRSDMSSPFVGTAFHDALWPDAPHRTALDEVSGSRAVVLLSNDLHCVWLNSVALEMYGFADHPTGVLREDDAFAVSQRLLAAPDAVLDGWVDSALRSAATRGIVGIVDLEMRWNLDDWMRRRRSGSDSTRIEFGIYAQHLDRAIELGLRTGQQLDELTSVGRLKVVTDGSLGTRTAFCYDEYPGLSGPDSHGLLTLPPHEVMPLIRRAVNAGIEPTVHAIGDHANALVLDAYEQLGIPGRIEHAQLLRESDVARFAQLGIVASVQPEHAMDDRDIADRFWEGRTQRSFMVRSLLDAGVELALGSDAPVAPLDPWVTIAAAVARSRDGRAPWHPEQAISVGDALFASTRTRIGAGEVADLVVLDADPWAASGDDVRRMPVAATILAGRFTHRDV
ncbi:amidohydrolase [Salinibacterium hongtaonis]|uniref:Amidohydrolase n=1 Tax=Homoserinimonas hongtaonis TaxID=2079791 RepID=A0A2U1SZ87_9MICO|nr:amidohydrolase family protein [Salinibacterium hongtaonis]PWB96937.1 amidohydrolase [Salinibacterium hongtaonis]